MLKQISRDWIDPGTCGSGGKLQPVWLSKLFEASEIVEGETVLDYGCGNGRLANFISSKIEQFQYFGLELWSSHGRDCISDARVWLGEDPRVQFGFIDAELEDEAISKADVVVLGSILPHLSADDSITLLQKFIPLLDRGGRICFSCKIEERQKNSGYSKAYGVNGCFNWIIHSKLFLGRIRREVAPLRKCPVHFKHQRYSHDFFMVERPRQ